MKIVYVKIDEPKDFNAIVYAIKEFFPKVMLEKTRTDSVELKVYYNEEIEFRFVLSRKGIDIGNLFYLNVKSNYYEFIADRLIREIKKHAR